MNPMADPIRKTDRHYSYRDYAEWSDDERWELIEGVAWNMSPAPSIRHQRILSYLYTIFHSGVGEGPCEVFFAPVDIFLFTDHEADIKDADTVVQPDLVVLCDTEKIVDRGYLGAPAIVVEVLSTYTMRKDITIKRDVYERAGVEEYWIVDPGNESIMIFGLDEDSQYPEDPSIFQAPEIAISKRISRISVPLPFSTSRKTQQQAEL
jgi:Uma2 family endonuclease